MYLGIMWLHVRKMKGPIVWYISIATVRKVLDPISSPYAKVPCKINLKEIRHGYATIRLHAKHLFERYTKRCVRSNENEDYFTFFIWTMEILSDESQEVKKKNFKNKYKTLSLRLNWKRTKRKIKTSSQNISLFIFD